MNFKTQQKIVLALVFLFALAYGSYKLFDLEVWWNNFSEKKRLPIEYKNYKLFEQIKQFGKHTITLAFESNVKNNGGALDKNIEHYLTENNEMIIQTTTQISADSLLYHFYKLDKQAKVIDSTSFLYSYLNKDSTGADVLFKGYIINKALHYYTTWPTDGNKNRIYFIPINKNLAWRNEKINSYYDSIKQNYQYLDELEEWESISPEENKMRTRKVYLLGKIWYILYGNNLKSGDINSLNRIGNENNVFKAYDTEAMASMPIVHNNFTLNYFHKVKYVKYETINYGSYDYYWEGVAYYNLIIGSDTLKFKANQKWYEDKKIDDFKLDYGFYENKNLNYALFTNNSKKLCIIK
jgi:hypothetical protein